MYKNKVIKCLKKHFVICNGNILSATWQDYAGINNTKYSVATENGQTIAKRC